MRVFGTGTLAALVSRASLAKFLAAHHHFYAELETRLDDAARGSGGGGPHPQRRAVASFLRRASKGPLARRRCLRPPRRFRLRASPHARRRRLRRRHRARRRARIFLPRRAPTPNRALLRALLRLISSARPSFGWPTKRALGLPCVPEFYRHDDAIVSDRRAAYVESVYEAINEVGSGLSGEATDEVAEEATRAFALNAAVFRENGGDSSVAAAAGGARALWGYAKERVWGASEQRDLFGRLVARRDPATGKFEGR